MEWDGEPLKYIIKTVLELPRIRENINITLKK